MKVFYHNDNDGKCAAAIIHHYRTALGQYKAIQYGDNFPVEWVDKNQTVVILDFSIEPEEMTSLLKVTEDVIWIDHHKTAIDKYYGFDWNGKNAGEAIRGLRRVGISGCELTWEYYYPESDPPEAAKLIGDRDIWAFKYEERTRNFYYGLKGVDISPKSLEWEKLFTFAGTGNYIGRGQIIRPAFETEANSIVSSKGFWVDFHGYKCFAANYFRGSEPFEAVEPDADVYLAFSYEGKNKCWTVSLYTAKPDIDVSEIAKQYEWHGKRGGGHKGAAGFQSDYPPFLREMGEGQWQKQS